jgi:MFS family permease
MTLGLVISSVSWLFLAIHPSAVAFVAALIVLALGEITQSARYYEYISRLAPPGQQGLYMGYAFLPIAIGYFIAGPLGGYLLHEFGDVLNHPQQMWWVVTAVGLVGAVMMVIYNKVFQPGTRDSGLGTLV